MTRPAFGICVSLSLLLATSGCALLDGTGYTNTAASDAGQAASSGGAQNAGGVSTSTAPQAAASGSGSTASDTPAGASEPAPSDPGSGSSSASGSGGGSSPFSKGASGQKIALPNVNLIESGGGSPVIMDPDKSIVGSTTLQNSINPQSQQINVQGLNPGAFQTR